MRQLYILKTVTKIYIPKYSERFCMLNNSKSNNISLRMEKEHKTTANHHYFDICRRKYIISVAIIKQNPHF
jgi:hypothetical protein